MPPPFNCLDKIASNNTVLLPAPADASVRDPRRATAPAGERFRLPLAQPSNYGNRVVGTKLRQPSSAGFDETKQFQFFLIQDFVYRQALTGCHVSITGFLKHLDVIHREHQSSYCARSSLTSTARTGLKHMRIFLPSQQFVTSDAKERQSKRISATSSSRESYRQDIKA